MANRFIAIGVGQGDAFFCELDGHTVLVDGGRSKSGFAGHFSRVTGRKGVDMLICTHNDADHANGIIGFLQSGLKCREVWLPASWLDRLQDLTSRPLEFVEELLSDVGREQTPPVENMDIEFGFHLLQWLGDRYAQEGLGTHEGIAEEGEDVQSILIQVADCESDGDWPSADIWYMALGSRCELFWPYVWRTERWRAQLLLQAIAAGEHIRQIARLAYHRGCIIRWFEYAQSQPSGGDAGVLIPLNAREVARVRVRKWAALEFLALTTANRQSLVIAAPQNDGRPGVLFTADSDLSFKARIDWHDGMIVTAPHHGSEANQAAYKRFQREMSGTGHTRWVRSDGRFLSRPGASFLALTEKRYCTVCRGSDEPKQDVKLVIRNGRWVPLYTRKCGCV